jgi:type VI secretion system protein ImpL
MKGFNLYWGAAASLIFFVGVGFLCAHFLHLQGQEFMFFMMLMSALGISASAFFYFFQSKAQQRAEPQAAGAGGGTAAVSGSGASPEVDQLIKEADQRLAASKNAQGVSISNLPLIFVIGDQGATKTSVILHSGLEPELLAGQVYQGNDVASTATGNVWFARNSIFIEAGGRLLAKPDSWTKLVKRLQPGKLKSVMAKGQQSPRAVLLCFDCEAFTKQGAGEQVAATARYIQARLGEISQLLGISFPVYVLFTKADRLAFFGDYFRNLSSDEATQVFGVTLPIKQVHGGVYAEEESRRLSAAFDELLHSLCDRRIDFLPREHDAEKIPGAYEFPREFRKLRAALVQLLVDIGRPSQLRASPFLRGFYFSGVRPVVIQDVASAPVRPEPAGQKGFDAGATRMFRAGMDLPQGVAQAQPSGGGTRRVPQWMFLSHLFNDVMLQDHAAMAASGSSVKVSGMRRLLLGLGSLLFLLLSGMFLWAWLNNRSLEKETIAAAQNLAGERVSGTNLPTLTSLQKLDRLRVDLQQLSDWDKAGHPFMYGWFLYSGHDLLPYARRSYYRSFKDLLFGQVQGNWITYLQSVKVPPAPTDDYGFGYNTLKAYLLTTSEYKRTSEKVYQDFLADTLQTRWPAGRDAGIDKPMNDLAKAQFDFYSHDLQNGNPYSDQAEADTLEHARDYLSRFNGKDRVYQALLSEAARKGATINFNHDYPGSDRVMRNSYTVPAAYTKNAWPYMMQLIADAEKRFGGEKWVLGDRRGPTITDWAQTKKDLADTYLTEYIKNWRAFVANSHFAGYGGLEDAASKLAIISANDSLYMRLFGVISTNTGVDPRVKTAFESADKVVPADSPVLITDSTRDYMTSLNGLQLAIQSVIGKPLDASAAAPIDTAAMAATSAQFRVKANLPPDQDAHVDNAVASLLLDPITHAQALSKGFGTAGLNGAAKLFCAATGFGKFPFNPNSTDDASLQEVNEIFRPKEGSLWQLSEKFKQALTCSNAGCAATGTPALTPAFVAFMSQAVQFSKALYGDAGTDPTLKYTVRPHSVSGQMDAYVFTADGASTTLKSDQQGNFTWSGASTKFGLVIKVAGRGDQSGAPTEGLWAPFHFFRDADSTVPNGSASKFVFKPHVGTRPITDGKDQPLVYEIQAPAVFNTNIWKQTRCVSNPAK